MTGTITRHRATALALIGAAALLAACGGSSSSSSSSAASSAAEAGSSAVAAASSTADTAASAASSVASEATSAASSAEAAASSTTAAPADPFATPNAASGDPIVFGLLSVESGPVVFPEVKAAEEAAVRYLNEFQGGIDGRPIKLETCATDGQPATSARCAGQILDKKPVAILGGADFGSPGSIQVYDRADMAYLGGVPFTPVESAFKNAVIFSSIAVGDNAAASVYAVQQLGVKNMVVIYADAPPGQASSKVIESTAKNAGAEKVKLIPIPETAADASSYAAAAVAENPDAVYVDSPSACGAILKSLKQLGYKGTLLGIDQCSDPRTIAASDGGAEGLYFAQPVLPRDSGEADTNLYDAVMKKYAPADTPSTSLGAIGFQTVMNVQAALNGLDPASLTTAGILAKFRDGTDNPNFMGHPYTCDGKQLAGAPAICNAYQQIRQIKGDKVVSVGTDWFTAGEYYKPAA